MALWELRPTDRFTSRAESYRRHRPGYPDAAIEALLALAPKRVADIGAGTGISCLPFLERGLEVVAVEPNAAMRAAGIEHHALRWVDGSAENTGLSDASVDLVTCFQSFHWFEPTAAMPELVRILRPGGALAAVWNERDDDDAFTAAYGELVQRISQHHPAEQRTRAVAGLVHPRLAAPSHSLFPNAQPLDREGLLGRAASTSFLPESGPAYEAMVAELAALFDAWQAGGEVTLRYQTHVFFAALTP